MNRAIKILETPRDAMQGFPHFIPTLQKISYLNTLLKVGFTSIDFGSFVSSKAIPQLADSDQVIDSLDFTNNTSEIVATIGNVKGAQRAFSHKAIDTVAFPFSISESFLKKNINSNFTLAEQSMDEIQNLCIEKGKKLKLYIAMAFGNPYNDAWSLEILGKWVEKIIQKGIIDIALADTTGDGSAETIGSSFAFLQREFPGLQPAVHLHTTPQNWYQKVEAAYAYGCRSFDAAIGGLGGCPMSGKPLTGNLDTQLLLNFLHDKNEIHGLNLDAFSKAKGEAIRTFI